MTRRHEPHPSARNSKIAPSPLKHQPNKPPPVKTASPTTMIPMIANISILKKIEYTPSCLRKQNGEFSNYTFLMSHHACEYASCACLLKPAFLMAA